MLKQKLQAEHEYGTKHDFWYVRCDGKLVGKVKDVKGDGELHNRERGNVADSLKINEHTLRGLVSCTVSKEDFCRQVNPPPAPPPPATPAAT